MGFFDNALVGLGVKSVQIDTIFDRKTIELGNILSGKVELVGTVKDVEINEIIFELVTEYKDVIDDEEIISSKVLAEYSIAKNIYLAEDEEVKIKFELEIPVNIPITSKANQMWINTRVDIPMAIDPKDRDYIKILPNDVMDTVLKVWLFGHF